MAKEISTGNQDFKDLIENDDFYIDKSLFIKEWWESRDIVTLITRPRRFGKTINMSMLKYFFSIEYQGRSDLFEKLAIWKEEKFRNLQGTYPVLFLSFAGVKQDTFEGARQMINELITQLFTEYSWLTEDGKFTDKDRFFYDQVSGEMKDAVAGLSLNCLCDWLYRYYGKKCIVILDEYDTPLQEAYIHGYWKELVTFTRSLFNNTFKTNKALERALMTGITRVSKESIFSDLNNLKVVTTTSSKYATFFGFTEDEVFAALEEKGYGEKDKEKVKFWYDGFIFGDYKDIYNPWSVSMFLDDGKYDTHWANTSGNGLVGKLVREGSIDIKSDFEELLDGKIIEKEIDEQIVYDQLDGNENSVWSLLLASGYLKVEDIIQEKPEDDAIYRLSLTNFEVRQMFNKLIKGWFAKDSSFPKFISAMFRGDTEEMNIYMNKVALNTFSSFDAGKGPSEEKEPEKFYHGFVLGLLVENAKEYIVKSNRESGYGRYDVVLEPKDIKDIAVIMEYKVLNRRAGEKCLEDTAADALKQIEEKKYDTDLLQRGIPADRVLKYGFAFEGEKCFIARA